MVGRPRLPALGQRVAPLLLAQVGVPGQELAAAAGCCRGADLLAVLELERGHLLAVGAEGLEAGGVLVHASQWQGLLAAEALLALFVEMRLGLAYFQVIYISKNLVKRVKSRIFRD